MSLAPDVVAAASRAWVWVPDSAIRIETPEYLLVQMPEWFGISLELLRFDPQREAGEVVDEVLQRARELGKPEVNCWVKLHNDPALDEVFRERGGVLDETLAVLALDLAGGLADGPPGLGPVDAFEMRWAIDLQTMRDNLQIGADVFGDMMPPGQEIAAEVERAQKEAESGSGSVVAYVDGAPVGCGGIALVDGVARLWGGAVREEARGRGAYRTLVNARLRRGLDRGATMALVKGRVQTSGPILRRAGFERYGEERSYLVPLS